MASQESKAPEWETHANEAAKKLGLPETEVVEQTKAAIVRAVAERIAEDQIKKWRQESAPPLYFTGMEPGAGEMTSIEL